MRARKEPLILLLSNAGYDKAHFYYTQIYQHAKAVLSGESTDTTFLPVVYEVPEEADWKDAKNWPLANPGITEGVISLEALQDDFQDALRSRAGEMHFRRFSLNQWTSKQNAWLDLADWDACKGAYPDLSQAAAYVACDLSATQDLTSIVAVYPINDRYYVRNWNFATRASLERRAKANLKDYQEFEYSKDLAIISGNAIEYDRVRDCIKKIPGKVQMVIFDKWSSLETSQLLQKEGYDVLTFPQTATYYNEPTKKLEQLVLDRKIVHDGNLCLRWALNNVQLEQDNKGLVRPVKPSEHAKIDPAVCLIMALSQAVLHASKVTARKSVYDSKGIWTL